MALAAATTREEPAKRKRGRPPALTVVQPVSGPSAEARKYAQCRSLGHTWKHRKDPVGADAGSPPSWLHQPLGIMSVCTDCGCERIKWIGRSGTLGTTTYRYPEGYQTRGEETVDRQTWRRTWIVSVFGDES